MSIFELSIIGEEMSMVFKLSRDCFDLYKQYNERYPFKSGRVGTRNTLEALRSLEYKKYQTALDKMLDYLKGLEDDTFYEVIALLEYGRELSHYEGIGGLLAVTQDFDDEEYDEDYIECYGQQIQKGTELYRIAIFLGDKSILLFPIEYVSNAISGYRGATDKSGLLMDFEQASIYKWLTYAREAINYLSPNFWPQ